MVRRTRRWLAAAVASMLLAAGAVAVAPSVSAAPIGTLTIAPTSGNFFTAWGGTTSGGCPASTTSFLIRMSGPGITATPYININGAALLSSVGATAGGGAFEVDFSKVLDTVKSDNGGTLADGTYLVELVCRQSSTSVGEFTADVVISTVSSVQGWTYQAPVVAENTTTTLSATPNGTVNWGAAITLSATVAPNPTSANVPTGTVQFKDGATNVGSPVAVGATGVATTVVSNLGLGAHTITAEYTPSRAFNASTSSTVPLTVALGSPTVVAVPTLSGTVRVGGTVKCNAGTWALATSYSYEFKTNGATLQAAGSDSDVVLASSDLGKSLTCTVTAINPNGQTAATTTAATVAAGTFVNTTKPRIVYSGTPVVGKTFTANRGVWSPTPSTYYYIWKRGTTIVKQGSTATSYKASSLDKGKTITLTVRVTRAGYTTASAVSAGVKVR